MTQEEAAWIRKMQKLLAQCPERFGFYTIGDPELTIFDRSNEHLFNQDIDMVCEVDKHDAHLGVLNFPSNVHGVCG